MEASQNDSCYNTDTTRKKQQIPTAVSNSAIPTGKEPYQTRTRSKRTRSKRSKKDFGIAARSRWNPEDWPEIEKWLAGKNQDFRDQIWRWAEYQLDNKKASQVDYPESYKKGAVWKAWKDDTDNTHLSDFNFIDHSGLEELAHRPTIQTERPKTDQEFLRDQMDAKLTPEEAMEKEMLLLQEVIYGES